MTTHTRKYYVLIPTAFSSKEEAYWHELLEAEELIRAKTFTPAKTLTAARYYVDYFMPGIPEPEIAVSVNEGEKTVVSKKTKEGMWEMVYQKDQSNESDDSDPYANDQIGYHCGGKRVSRKEFFFKNWGISLTEESI
jgi:hypothetical protein